MTAFVHLVIGCENLRTEARLGGGFTILVGEPGSSQRVSFKSVEAAEAFGRLCALAAITHGPLGDALAATDPAASNVTPFRPRVVSTDGPPLDAA